MMPQTFQVVRCYKCSAFQAHLRSKSKRYECKICGEKQSFKRFYGLGTPKACRFQVQKLNAMRGQLEQDEENTDQDNDSSREAEEIETQPVKDNCQPVKISKWSKYIEKTGIEEANTNTNKTLGNAEVDLELPPKRKKINTNNNKTSFTFSSGDHEKTDEYDKVPPVVPVALVNVVSSKVYHPEETFNNIKLNNNKLVLPTNNKNSKWAQFTEPDLTEQTSLLEHSENLDDPCSDSMMTKPFTWGDETRDDTIDTILGI